MKFCYVDESGTGDEPIATMVGIVVDATRMHVTKDHWNELLSTLSRIVGRHLAELHTRDFYAGSGVWYQMKGPERSNVISEVLTWLTARKHHVVYSAVVKSEFFMRLGGGQIPSELSTPWRFLGYHIILSIQKKFQCESKLKGNTVLVFDNEERERMRFTDLITNPPAWSDAYYCKDKHKVRLDQIVDVPYFGDSREVPLIQVADFLCFFLRRYCEIKENLIPPRYADEAQKIEDWATAIGDISIGRTMMYPSRGRCDTADLYWALAPDCIRKL